MLKIKYMYSILVLFLLLTLVGNASATTYYASPSGSGNGLSVSTPCDLYTGVHSLVAGDTLYLLDGTYMNGEIQLWESGTPTNPIKILAYPGAHPWLTTNSYSGSSWGSICFGGIDNIIMGGIKLTHVYTGLAIAGSNIYIYDCEFGDTAASCLFIGDVYSQGIHDVTLYNCKIHDSNMLGDYGPNMIEIEGNQKVNTNGKTAKNITLRHCNIYGNTMHQTINVMNCAPGRPGGETPQYTTPGLTDFTLDDCDIHDVADSDGLYSIYGDFQYANIINNRFYNLPNYGINAKFDYSNISNNTFTDIGSSTPNSDIYLYASSGTTYQSHDTIIANNRLDYTGRIRIESGTNMNIRNNSVAEYYLIGCGATDIVDGWPVAWPGNPAQVEVIPASPTGQHRIVYTDGAKFMKSGAAASIQYTNGQSILNCASGEDVVCTYIMRTPTWTVDKTKGTAPQTVQFAYNPNSGDVNGYQWSFGDGTSNSTSQNPTHTYSAGGTYNVALTTTNAQFSRSNVVPGQVSLTSSSSGTAPTASFTTDTSEGYTPLIIQFTDTSTGNPSSWNYSFGDGTYSSSKSPTHTYRSTGNFNVKLTVSNAYGTSSKQATIKVLSQSQTILPVASFSCNITEGYVPLSVQFNDSSKNATSWNWDFGDGSSSTQKNAMHTYSATGNYTVKLTVSNTNGTDSKTCKINVLEKEKASTLLIRNNNRLRETTPDNTFSNSQYLDIGGLSGVGRYRDVLSFDLSGVKSSTQIKSATLSLFWYYPSESRLKDTVVEIYRPSSSWNPNYVSWNKKDNGIAWSKVGGDWYDKKGVLQGSTPYATLTLKASSLPSNNYCELNVTDLVKEYVGGKYSNTGFLIKARSESDNYIAFYSADIGNKNQVPKLSLVYN